MTDPEVLLKALVGQGTASVADSGYDGFTASDGPCQSEGGAS